MTKPLAALLTAAALSLAACGGGYDSTEAQQRGEELRQQGEQLREKAERTAEQVRSGDKDPAEAAEELRGDAEELQDEAIDTTNDLLDDAQEQSAIPDGADDQIDAAQAELEQAAR